MATVDTLSLEMPGGATYGLETPAPQAAQEGGMTTPVQLHSFFIFNPTLATDEGESHKKILYYYPESASADAKLRNVGLCEALANFTRTFAPNEPCEVLHTQKARYYFLQPEPHFWMVMVLGLPTQHRSRGGRLYVEYLAEEVQDDVYGAVLDAAYRTFRLFEGTFSDLRGEPSGLKRHFDRHASSPWLRRADLLDVFRGVRFLPLDRRAFLGVQSFVNLLESTFRQIRYTVFLCNDQLVWSGLDRDDVRTLHHFLRHDVLQGVVESELRRASAPPHGRFPCGPVAEDDDDPPSRILRVHTSAGEECRLLVFRTYGTTLCVLVEEGYETTFLKELEAFLSSELTPLANDIGRSCAKFDAPVSAEAQVKYVYFNRLNLAQKSSIHAERRACVPSELVRFLADVHRDLSLTRDSGEMVAKTTGDWWASGKSSDGRELYVVHDRKSANILQMAEEVKKLCSSQFNNIFLFD